MSSDTKIRPRPSLSVPQIKAFEDVLRDLRRRFAGGIDALAEEATRSPGDSSPAPQHLGDLGSDASEQDLSLNLMEGQRESLNRIDRALERIADGTYGVCESCGEPIALPRLEAIPHADLCMACQLRDEEAE